MSPPRIAGTEAPAAASALVLAPEGEVLARLVTELVTFGYQPRIMLEDAPVPAERPAVTLVASAEGIGAAAARTAAIAASEHMRGVPVVWLIPSGDVGALGDHTELMDEFVTLPWTTGELEARLRLLHDRLGSPQDGSIRRGPVTMNVDSYQVTLEGRPVDLTFMEYELLKLFMSNPGRVFRREEILSRVWGYDYYGGMRTVDVHVRRLRAKLGQDHAWIVETVRSVGYRLAQLRS